MPQEQLKPSFESISTDNSSEQLSSIEQVTESSATESITVSSQPVVDKIAISPSSAKDNQPIQMTSRQIAIDDILEDGLAEIYSNLSPDKQIELKKMGEQTVHQIDQLLNHAKSQLSKIIGLIRRFLAIIPGVNHFFLEQEVKIKTDKIMSLKDK